MIKYQEAKIGSYLRIKDFNVKYHTELALIVGYFDEATKMENALTAIQKAAIQQDVETGGIVRDLKTLWSKMGDVTIKYALLGAVEARNAGNNELDKQLSHYKTFITKPSKEQAIINASKIREALNNNLHTIANPDGIIHNVIAANIAEIDKAIADFAAAEELPEEAIKTKKTQGTEMLPPEFDTADNAVTNMYDLVYSTFSVSKPEILNEFVENKKLAVYGIHHTGLLVHVVDANPPEGALTDAIENILVKLTKLDRSAVTDIKGFAGITKFVAGTYYIEFSGEGWKTKTLLLTFKRGQMVEIEVEMERS
jgi:hypothetical protein